MTETPIHSDPRLDVIVWDLIFPFLKLKFVHCLQPYVIVHAGNARLDFQHLTFGLEPCILVMLQSFRNKTTKAPTREKGHHRLQNSPIFFK